MTLAVCLWLGPPPEARTRTAPSLSLTVRSFLGRRYFFCIAGFPLAG